MLYIATMIWGELKFLKRLRILLNECARVHAASVSVGGTEERACRADGTDAVAGQ